MAICRTHKKENPFVMLDKTVLLDTRLSAKAKGVHSYLMSLPSNWNIIVDELTMHFTDGKASIYTALKELKQYHYIVHERERATSGVYHVFETPQTSVASTSEPHTDFPHVDNPHVVCPHVENRPLINIKNNKYINKINNNKNNKAAAKEIGEDLDSTTAAAFSDDKKINPYLGKQLTEDQKRYVAHRVQHSLLAQARFVLPNLPANLLIHDIEQCLLDPKRFAKTGRDFFFKLNAIAKAIVDGQWKSSGLDNMHEQLQ